MTSTNTIKWIRHEVPRNWQPGTTLYSASGPFEWAGDCAFEIACGNTIGKPYSLRLVYSSGAREFVGAFATVSGAKQRAKKFGTWRG
jgi:hypothetical protein